MKTLPFLLAVIYCAMALSTSAQQTNLPPAATPSREEVLNDGAISEMKQAGFGDSVLLEKIKDSNCDFDTSLEGLKKLKSAGVSDAVITAMVSAKGGANLSQPGPGPSADINNPASSHDAGIWIYEEDGGKSKMTQLEPSVYSQSKSGSLLFVQWGATVKQQAVIRGAHAELLMTNRKPVFYFYFEHAQAGLSDSNGATSPNEYILAQFETTDDKNNHERRLVMGSLNAYAGNKTGTDSKSVCSFDFQKFSPGIYRVSPKQGLGDGEYGFFYGGTTHDTTGGKVFDFGIKGSAETESQSQSQINTNKTENTKHRFPWFNKKSE